MAVKESKQVGNVSSGERRITVAIIGCIKAVRNSLPPVLIFTRVHFKICMLTGATPGIHGYLAPVAG